MRLLLIEDEPLLARRLINGPGIVPADGGLAAAARPLHRPSRQARSPEARRRSAAFRPSQKGDRDSSRAP